MSDRDPHPEPAHSAPPPQSQEEVLHEEVDIEAFTKEHQDRAKPHAQRYRMRIDREIRVVDVPTMTGREILKLVGMTSESHKLYELVRGQQPRRVGADEPVDFTRPGVERFQTIPLDPTEG